jgi:WD40 repeat protein
VWQVMTRLRTARCVATMSISPPTFVYSAAFPPTRPDVVVSGSFDGMLRLWQVGSDEVTAAPGPVTPRRPPLAPSTPGGAGPDPPMPALPPWAYGGGLFPDRCRGLFRGFLGCPPGIQGLSTARRAGESAITRSAHGGAALFSPTRPGSKGRASIEGFGAASPGAGASGAGAGAARGSSSPHSSHINCVQFHPSGGRLFSADGAGKIVIWDCGSSAAGPLAYKVRESDFQRPKQAPLPRVCVCVMASAAEIWGRAV